MYCFWHLGSQQRVLTPGCFACLGRLLRSTLGNTQLWSDQHFCWQVDRRTASLGCGKLHCKHQRLRALQRINSTPCCALPNASFMLARTPSAPAWTRCWQATRTKSLLSPGRRIHWVFAWCLPPQTRPSCFGSRTARCVLHVHACMRV